MPPVPGTSERILIAGGGIGGLAAGLAFQLRGFSVLVCERAPVLHEVGAGLLLSPNAVHVLDLLGLGEAARKRSRLINEWRILNPRGGLLHRMHPDRAGKPALSLHRADLQMLLRSQLAPGILRLCFEGAGHTQSADGVELASRAGERLPGAILVGADGLQSRVRAQLHGEQAARFVGYTGWRCVAPAIPRGYEGSWLTESWGEGKRFGISPLGDNRCYWYATTNGPAGVATSPNQAKQQLLDVFGHWHAPIPELIAGTRADDILRSDIFDRPNGIRWTDQRVTLLGDAAHPMTPNLGQGACAALEDAWVLAKEVAGAESWTEGLRRYEAARRPRADLINSASHLLGRIIQLENPLAAAIRNGILRLTPEPISGWTMRPLFSFHP
jgi:2-polyprenyl-6-methoxyphenol hydroxylase-like FAD-dependent oxidoreductase